MEKQTDVEMMQEMKQGIQRISTLIFEMLHALQLRTSYQCAVQFSVHENIFIYKIITLNMDTEETKSIPVFIDMNTIADVTDEELISKPFMDIFEQLEKVHTEATKIHIVKG